MDKVTTKEIEELNTGDVYRLKDKEGWLGAHVQNRNYFEDVVDIEKGFKLTYVCENCGEVEDQTIIAENEYEFFEVVVQESVPSDNHLDVVKGTLWDGKSTLEVGMIVKYKGYDFPVEFISEEGTQAVMKGILGLQVVLFKDLKAAAKSKKEATLDKVLTAWQGKHLDYAHDTKSSTVPFGEVFDLIYDVMEGE